MLTEGDGTAILVRRCIHQHAVSIQGLVHQVATTIPVISASKPMKILMVYQSPSRTLMASELSASLGGGFFVVVAGDLNAKHVEWISWLLTNRDRLLRDYADKESCLIYGPNTPTTLPYNPSATPDVLNIVITEDLVTSMYPTTFSAISSDHLPILIDKLCRPSFIKITDHPDSRKIDWSKYRPLYTSDLQNEVAIDACNKELSSTILKALVEFTPFCRPR